jgi:hypothetical protein
VNDVTLIVVVDSPMSRYRLITFGVINVIPFEKTGMENI